MIPRLLAAAAALLAALVAAGPAAAQEPPPPEPVIASGVTVAGVDVAGKTAAEATAVLQSFFNERLTVRFGSEVISVRPAVLGARARIAPAVSAALLAPADTALELGVAVTQRRLKQWVLRRAKGFDRAAVSSTARLVRGTPRLTSSRPSRALLRGHARARLKTALRTHDRGSVWLPVKRRQAAITPREVGPVVVIRRGSKVLTLYRGKKPGPMRAVRSFPVATGMAAYPTPLGSFRIVTRQRNPWWYPPATGWAAGASPIPPGPGNPLGTRWMGLNVGAVGIHGTPNAASIGYSASHGCIRMHIGSAEWLFERVRVGTPVFIIGS